MRLARSAECSPDKTAHQTQQNDPDRPRYDRPI